ncbi:MAG: 6-phosphogluconolactonase [Candidatus Saccharimonadales bacterium]
MAEVRVLKDVEAVARAAAKTAIAELQAAIRANGSATWVLAGGTSPGAAYRVITQEYRNDVDWQHVRVLMGDERCVLSDNPDFNWRQASEVLLRHLDLSAAGRLEPKGGVSAEEAAEHYESLLERLPHNKHGRPRLDHVWLGVGEDGHTLSLFPNHPDAEPSQRLVVPVHNSPKPPPDRISLTLRALEGAASCLVLAAGAGKAEALRRALNSDSALPIAQAVKTVEDAGGRVTWLVDEAAAGK